ncbi:MAG: aminotransferase [Verrucomicrobia bacterium]|nr:MAG: aminotransferase [Verrucomicrobiota bacterium]
MSIKLYTPGPVEVSPEILQAMALPMIPHRSKEFQNLYYGIQQSLQKFFYTQDPIFLATSSAWGGMEGAIRNLVNKKVLNCMSGGFSDKWHPVSLSNDKNATPLQFEWGNPVIPEAIDAELSKGGYDAITLIHNETSTGTMNPIESIMEVIRKYPELISIVDVVSSFSVMEINKDKLGIDVMIASSQKALALPPGLCLFSVSKKALNRAKTINNRGFYFDYLEFLDKHLQNMTPTTPAISLFYALDTQLKRIEKEGLENRYKRHKSLNNKVHDWIKNQGFELFPSQKYASLGLSCIKNTRQINLELLNNILKNNYKCLIDCGYGKLRGSTFRISNMGDETEDSMNYLLHSLDRSIEKLSL